MGLSALDYQDDILIMAGDLTDNLRLLEACMKDLAAKFRKVLFVPGNHELWVVRDGVENSFRKFERVMEICADCGVGSDVYQYDSLSIVPLFGWYDFSFGKPGSKLLDGWSDFKACSWPDGYAEAEITGHFVDMNKDRLDVTNGTVISFSHFLPRIDVMPWYIHPSQRFLYPVLGSDRIGDQVDALKPAMHIYGHSHVNNRVQIDGVDYINNAFGYPAETRIAGKELVCIHEQPD